MNMRRLVPVVLLLVVASLLSAPAVLGGNGWEAYNRIYGRRVSYRALVLVESAGRQGSVEMVVLNDIREFRIRQGGKVITMAARRNLRSLIGNDDWHRWGRVLGLSLPERPDLLRKNYHPKTTSTIFLGRAARRVELTPRYAGNPRRVAIIDEATGVMLFAEDRDRNGDILMRRRFVQFEVIPFERSKYRRLSEALMENGHETPKFLPAGTAGRKLGFAFASPSYLPPGYALLGFRISPRHKGTAHGMLTDGLGLVSLYATRVPWWARHSVPPKAGAVIEWEQHGVRYVLIGDVPGGELLKIARSIR